MFDIGFSQMMLIAIVALIVLGPQRLPKVARTVGHLLGRLQRYVADVKADVSREMQLEDLKKLQQQVQDQAREIESSLKKQVEGVENSVRETEAELKKGLDLEASFKGDAAAPVSDAKIQPVSDGLAGGDASDAAGERAASQSEAKQSAAPSVADDPPVAAEGNEGEVPATDSSRPTSSGG